jgi:hypothetical protein
LRIQFSWHDLYLGLHGSGLRGPRIPFSAAGAAGPKNRARTGQSWANPFPICSNPPPPLVPNFTPNFMQADHGGCEAVGGGCGGSGGDGRGVESPARRLPIPPRNTRRSPTLPGFKFSVSVAVCENFGLWFGSLDSCKCDSKLRVAPGRGAWSNIINNIEDVLRRELSRVGLPALVFGPPW